MEDHKVTVFTEYPFESGQKINIADGPRKGDWLVTEVTGRKVKLRCPVSGHEVEWHKFCYFVETRKQAAWPVRD